MEPTVTTTEADELRTYLEDSHAGAVLGDRRIPLLTFADSGDCDRKLQKLENRSLELYTAVIVLLWRLEQHDDVCASLDGDADAVAATMLLARLLSEVKGVPFSVEDFK